MSLSSEQQFPYRSASDNFSLLYSCQTLWGTEPIQAHSAVTRRQYKNKGSQEDFNPPALHRTMKWLIDQSEKGLPKSFRSIEFQSLWDWTINPFSFFIVCLTNFRAPDGMYINWLPHSKVYLERELMEARIFLELYVNIFAWFQWNSFSRTTRDWNKQIITKQFVVQREHRADLAQQLARSIKKRRKNFLK